MCQDCKACHKELSRLHAVQCAGVDTYQPLIDLVNKVQPDLRFGLTPIDVVINAAAESMTPAVARVIVAAIDLIEVKCHGRARADSGFWT